MSIYNDRYLFKLITTVVVVAFTLLFGLVTASYGLQPGLFVIWIFLSLLVFGVIVFFTIEKPFVKNQSKVFSAVFIGYFLDIFLYRAFLFLIFLAWCFLSLYIWDFLGNFTFLNKKIETESSVVGEVNGGHDRD